MKLISRILLATDLTAAQEPALQTTSMLARLFSSSVDLLHVIEGFFDPPVRRSWCRRRDSAALKELGDRLTSEGVMVGQTLVRSGEASACIDETAQARNANVIVIGGRRETAGAAIHLGDVAQSLLAQAVKPVWVAAPGSAEPVRRIVCPVDFSEASGRALQNALHLARRCRAAVWVIHVARRRWWYIDEDAAVSAAHDAQSRFDAFMGRYDLTDLTCRTMVTCGHPAMEVLKLTAAIEADLLIMGSMGWSSWRGWMMGQVAAQIAQHPPCALLMVKAEDAVRLDVEDADDRIAGEFARGRELLADGFLQESIEALDRYLSVNPRHAPSWEALAEAHRRLHQKRDAERCQRIAQVIQRQP